MKVRNALSAAVALVMTLGMSSCGMTEKTAEKPSESDLERTAHELDILASERQDQKALDLYSQRCKDEIGGLENYTRILDMFFAGRTPQYVSASAKVNGSSGTVVSIDQDPTAPASAVEPRTWTFIDGRWQFDNC